jgi:hypothetical protein
VNDACVAKGEACEDDFDCAASGDGYCEQAVAACLPAPVGARCEVSPEFDRVAMEEEWHWPGITVGGRFFANVMDSPVVGDVSGDGIPDVLVHAYSGSDWSGDNVLVALRGDTGDLLFALGPDGDDAPASHGVAVADLDPSDEALEVAYRIAAGGVQVIDGDGATVLARRRLTSSGRGTVEIADLDQDGVADLVVGCRALNGIDIEDPVRDLFDHGSCTTSSSNSVAAPSIADLNGDGLLDVTTGRIAITTDGTILWQNASSHGFTAVADFDTDGAPEVVVVEGGRITIRQGTTGAVWLGPVTLPGGGTGGPPNVGDFDGDGLPEVGVAGSGRYALIDPDCEQGYRTGGVCDGTNVVRWAATTQDVSSSTTGSSVFDFQGDGVAEVIYNDECFLHVLDGRTGAGVLASPIPSSSRTFFEYPLVVDVDRDGNSEVVVGSNLDQAASRDGCPSAYATAFGVPVDALPAAYARGTQGIRVYGDPNDRWVATRPIWNQYSYHVTNVSASGDVPAVEADNFRVAGLNNYRQNVQGSRPRNAPNLTVRLSTATRCSSAEVTLVAEVRNEGSRGVPAGVSVALREATMGAFATLTTEQPIYPGGTARLVATAEDVPFDVELTFDAILDLEGAIVECIEDDNEATASTRCQSVH